jgi:hypothetical protein
MRSESSLTLFGESESDKRTGRDRDKFYFIRTWCAIFNAFFEKGLYRDHVLEHLRYALF